MSKKKTDFQANVSFLEKHDITGIIPWFQVACKHRQTSLHMVRQTNTKTTYFKKKND